MTSDDLVKKLAEEWRLAAESSERPGCPHCTSNTTAWNGWALRSATVFYEGKCVYVPEFPVRRVKCRECRVSWRILPEGFIPHKHFQPGVVARAVQACVFQGKGTAKVASESTCSRFTVRRWLRWLPGLGDRGVIMSKIIEATREVVLPPSIEPLTHVDDEVRLNAGRMLVLFEWLGDVWSLEPPGLRSVLSRVLRGLWRVATYADPAIPDFAR